MLWWTGPCFTPIIWWCLAVGSLLGSFWAWGHPALRSMGSMVVLTVTSKCIYAKGTVLRQLLPVSPLLWWAPADPCLHRRFSNTRRWFWFSFLWTLCSFAPFLWVLVYTRFCLCAGSPSLESLFPTDLWMSCNQIPLGFKIRVSGNSQPLFWVLRLGSLTRFWTFTSSGRTSLGITVLQFVYHLPGRYGIWFYHDCAHPTTSLWLLLCLWTWGIFFGRL